MFAHSFTPPTASMIWLQVGYSVLQMSDRLARLPMGSSSFLSLLCIRVPSLQCSFRTERKCVCAREGTVCTYFHQRLLDDSADVPSPLRNVRVVIIQVWRKGQAKRPEFLWGNNSRVITLSQVVFSKSVSPFIFYAKP